MIIPHETVGGESPPNQEILKDVALALDDVSQAMNTHSQDQCNDALYTFYKRVYYIVYGKGIDE